MKIAIQGHPTRGKEVIQILESLGGRNTFNYNGDYIRTAYFIGMDYSIYGFCTDSPKLGFKVYTLEEFEKEFPFKVGDKITFMGLDYPEVITKMTWMDNEIFYNFGDKSWYNTKALKKLEMKEERNITLTLDKAKEWYNKGGELREIALQAFSEKELTKIELPKTWEEFCNTHPTKKGEYYIDNCSDISSQCESTEGRDIEMDKNVCPSKKSAEAHLAMIQLEQLRNCWWNGWKPEWSNSEKYVIKWEGDNLIVFTARRAHAFLVFPTREIAEEFLKCFKDLIEKAGDLI